MEKRKNVSVEARKSLAGLLRDSEKILKTFVTEDGQCFLYTGIEEHLNHLSRNEAMSYYQKMKKVGYDFKYER